MYFTSDDITTIIEAISKRSNLKLWNNSSSANVNGSLIDVIDGYSSISVNNDDGNFRIYIKDALLCLSDFININSIFNVSAIDIEKAINLIVLRYRHLGQVITFTDEENTWVIYQYEGNDTSDTNWLDVSNWHKINKQ